MKKTVLTTLILLTAASATGFSFTQNSQAAIIDLSGSISPSKSGGLTSSSGITPGQVRNLNDRAVSQGADAIIYEMNSGGGAVVASKEIFRSIEDVEVPTVCRMRDIAASGGYMAALGCDRIVADSATLTGSIGVKSSYLQYTGLMDKLGIDYVNISAGSRKELGNPYMNITEEEKKILQDKIEKIQQDFLQTVEEERNLSSDQMENVSTGSPFLGTEAKKLGLVDSLGGRDTAVNIVENLTESKINTFKVQQEKSFDLLSLITADLSLEDFLKSSSPFKSEVY